jgi:hypothetical protein
MLLRRGVRRLLANRSAATSVAKPHLVAGDDGSLDVDGIRLDDETVSHFVDTVRSAGSRDLHKFQELAQRHMQSDGAAPDSMEKVVATLLGPHLFL